MRCITVILVLAVFLFGTAGLVFSSDSKVRVTASKANLRLKPDAQSVIVTSVPLGAVLDVIRKEREWYYVKLPPDEKGIVVTGFLHQSTVEVIEETNERAEPEKRKEIPQIAPKPVEPEKEVSANADYLRWKEDYYKAENDFKKWKKRASMGMYAMLGGMTITLFSPLLIRGEGAIFPLIAGSAAGLGGFGWWMYAGGKRNSANEKMGLLMNEGRIKKYLTAYLNPRTKTYAVTLTVTF